MIQSLVLADWGNVKRLAKKGKSEKPILWRSWWVWTCVWDATGILRWTCPVGIWKDRLGVHRRDTGWIYPWGSIFPWLPCLFSDWFSGSALRLKWIFYLLYFSVFLLLKNIGIHLGTRTCELAGACCICALSLSSWFLFHFISTQRGRKNNY